MKTLFVFCIICKMMRVAYYNHKDIESFFIFKCILYIIISSIHSVVVNIPLPLGACIMFIIYLFETKNRKIKLKMIGVGLLVVIISLINYNTLSYPFQKLYLYIATHDTQKIEVFAHTPDFDNYLFSITDSEAINEWISSLQTSYPSSSWSTKTIPNDNGYLLKLTLANDIINIFVSSNPTKSSNIFLGKKLITYTNTTIHSLITQLYPDNPSALTINTSKSASVNITNSTLLNILWRNVIWSQKEPIESLNKENFSIPSYLFFDKNLGCKLFFSYNFESAYIQNKGVIKLSPYLQSMLNEQFILSQLDIVDNLDIFKPAHIYNEPPNTVKFSIHPDENNLYYGLYREDYKSDEKVLLHTVSSPNTKFFLLKSPYILLLDEKSSSQYVLMFINQNVPEKHRYIEKNQTVLPHSISICPQNTKFTYIVQNQDISILYFVDNYYHSPTPISSGVINDSLFLSDDYIVFTQQIDNENLLCIYSITSSKIIKYILIPGNITLIQGNNNRVYFAVQKVDNKDLKQSIFYIDTTLTVHKYE